MSKRIPMIARGRRNRFFDTDGLDDLMAMVLELTSEVSVLKERQYVTERLLEENGLSISDGIENWQASELDQQRMAEQRKQLLERVLRTLEVDSKGFGEHSIDVSLEQPRQPANQGQPHTLKTA